MKNSIYILIISLTSLCLTHSCSRSVVGGLKNSNLLDSSSYKLIWADEFDSNGTFDNQKWSYAPRGRVAWNTYMTHSPEYVFQKDNKLFLRMDNKKIEGDNIPYHAGGIQSQGKFNIRYGKVVVRAKFTQGRGSWPAIWMMPEPAHSLGGWPEGGEIDIMEHVNNEDVVHQTIHNSAVTTADGGSSATFKTKYDIDGFNDYSIVWTPNKIDFFVNDKLTYTYSKTIDATAKEWPFDVPFYIILNQAGGLGWPGKITDEDLPFSMEVDYVRVYDLPAKELKNITPYVPVYKNSIDKARKVLNQAKEGDIRNPNFETNDLAPWTVWGNTGITNKDVHSGYFAVQSAGGETAIEQKITNLKPNTTYTFGAYAKISSDDVNVLIGVKEFGGAPVNTKIKSKDFADTHVTFTTGDNQNSAVVYFYKENSGTAYADDFYIRVK
jgi:beta-glucanase (GH16 family)